VRALAATAAIGLTLIAVAHAATVLRGATGDGVPVNLRLDSSGIPASFSIGPTTVPCKDGDIDVGRLKFSPLGAADEDSFTAKGRDRSEDGPFAFKSTNKLTGVAGNGGGWSGTYNRRTKVLRGGERVDRCSLEATWKAD